MKIMNKLFVLILVSTVCYGQQDKVKGKLSSKDNADLTILKIAPANFPDVSVLFKAETRKGEPVWNLTKEKMNVLENEQACKVVLLEPVTQNKPINLGIVIDHSGSMAFDASIFSEDGRPLFNVNDAGDPIYPDGYLPPIEHAKNAVKKFVKSFNMQKDFISVLGFSEKVDIKLPLTQNLKKINSTVDKMKADSRTALYDAMRAGLTQIRNKDGLNVLVVLTDGNDNSSRSKWNKVIKDAKKDETPIYIIGLGDVNKDTLNLIAQETNGHFYYTETSNSLDAIYAKISKQLQAYYNLNYTSTNFSSADTSREVELSFDIPSIFLHTEPSQFDLPVEVIDRLKKQEEFAQQQQQQQVNTTVDKVETESQQTYLLYGGIVILSLLVTGSIVYKFNRKKQDTPSIVRVFPNPSNGIVNIETSSNNGSIQIFNLNGQLQKTIPIQDIQTQIDLMDLTNGNYFAQHSNDGMQSKAVQFIISK
jgi:Ca-activated chloride channel family protein